MLLLVQAAWPNVQSLSLVGDFRNIKSIQNTTLDMCMCNWPALQTLTLGVNTVQTHNVAMSTVARARWPSLDLQLIPAFGHY